MTIGMIFLIVVSILIFTGLAQRVLDRMRLNDMTALGIIIAIILATIFIPNINITENFSINIGGFVIPMGLAIYLFIKADTNKEKWRAIIASITTGIIIYILQRYILPAEPEAQYIEPNYVYAISAAVVAYLMGRSRRNAFIAGVVGVVISDLIQAIINFINDIPAPTDLGGAGAVDTTLIAGILAVIIAEVVGETRERLQGGTDKKHMKFEGGEFVSIHEGANKDLSENSSKKRGGRVEK
ncbi:MAG: DUF1614 domain-containing protein [Clostridiales bacterium]|nr:DUF1614 domain-containing protein [Clostridiales bacterium]